MEVEIENIKKMKREVEQETKERVVKVEFESRGRRQFVKYRKK